MLPHSHDAPAGLLETMVGVGVSRDVALDLGGPELGVAFGGPMMFGAAVPEATVHEHGDFGSGEHEVGGAADLWYGAYADPVAQPERVDGGANCRTNTMAGLTCASRPARTGHSHPAPAAYAVPGTAPAGDVQGAVRMKYRSAREYPSPRRPLTTSRTARMHVGWERTGSHGRFLYRARCRRGAHIVPVPCCWILRLSR